ncbi:MAG: polysaccharide deacetylase family protein [Bacteroidales bacterium]|jgi:peptidoglycan/xylan/chitin deacetylase (PgdA/CDA1 family)
MLKYQKIVILFLALLVAALLANHYFHTGIIPPVCILAALVGFLVYGAMNVCSNYFCKVYCSADTDQKIIALTFDDGPDKSFTREILNILRNHNIRAAFFCIGFKAEKNPELVKAIDAEGHIIGSHSYSHHFFFDLFGLRRMIRDMSKCEVILNDILKKKIVMFRPPYGVTNPPLARAIRNFGYQVIGWSLKSKDTVLQEESILKRLKERVKPGDIILFHDTKSHTAAVLEKFILFALENDFSFECTDRLLKIKPYE